MTMSVLLAAALAAAAPANGCPDMSVYSVSGATARDMPLPDAVALLFDGTAWRGEVQGDAGALKVSFSGVSGPLDKVFDALVRQAGAASAQPLAARRDPTRCVATISVRAIPRAMPAVPATAAAEAAPVADHGFVLRAGSSLSSALDAYAKSKGWSLRWNVRDDYMLDADVTIPPMTIEQGITWVVRAYQAQGGLLGVQPRFARPNHVAVIEPMTVRAP